MTQKQISKFSGLAQFCLIFSNFALYENQSNRANTDLFKVNNRNSRKRFEICWELTVKTPERRQWRHWHYFTLFSSVSIIEFEQLNSGWEASSFGFWIKFVLTNKYHYFLFVFYFYRLTSEKQKHCIFLHLH